MSSGGVLGFNAPVDPILYWQGDDCSSSRTYILLNFLKNEASDATDVLFPQKPTKSRPSDLIGPWGRFLLNPRWSVRT